MADPGDDEEQLLCGWGGTAASTARVLRPESVDEVAEAVRTAGPRGLLARGLGRSYGDAAQNAGGTVVDLRRLDHIGQVDERSRELTCDAGATLDAVLRQTIPAGWFVPVTPGTRQVTLGGAVAADVHGKNHHRDGSLARHLAGLDLVDGTGRLRRLAPGDELFAATTGGMGLTGVITSVRLRMIPVESAWMSVDTRRTGDLDETMAVLAGCDTHRRYSVAWIDCLARGSALGRGVVTAGDHLAADAVPRRAATDPLRFVPRALPAPPRWARAKLADRWSATAFNAAYHRRSPRHATDVPTPVAAFFHPLDAVTDWNRLYGRAGFLQYQFAGPDPSLVADVLRELQRSAIPGLLAVLKRFGPGTDAPLSFPIAGWTLAVDIPARVSGLAETLDRLDRQVLGCGGRVYLAKDSRVRPSVLARMYPALDQWRAVRAAADPRGVFTSDLARRLRL
jgi:decaprenylphospho-beta-D-ribofuranose 2-oxidase